MQLQANLQMTPDPDFAKLIKELVLQSTKEALETSKQQLVAKEWMSIQEACKYANVSNVTFQKFRVLGLRIAEIDGIKRVSKKEIDRFLENNSY